MNATTHTALRYSRPLARDPDDARETRHVRAAVFAKSESELFGLNKKKSPDLSDIERRRFEKDFLARRFQLAPNKIVFVKQVHGTDAVQITTPPAKHNQADPGTEAGIYFSAGDALFTDVPGVLLAIRTADCLPLFFDLSLCDATANSTDGTPQTKPNRTVVGVIHAGWRGLDAGVISRTLIQALAYLYRPLNDPASNDAAREVQPRAARLRATFFFGPCIGPEAYEVDADVADRFTEKRAIARREIDPPGARKYLLDLPVNARIEIDRTLESHAANFALNLAQLVAGCEFIRDFEGCTFQEPDRFFSHRRGDVGRNLNTIMIEE